MLPRNWWMWGILTGLVVWIVLLLLPAAIATAQEPLPCAPQQWDALARRLVQQGSLTLTFTEAEFNACLARFQPEIRRRTPYRSIQVDFRPGRVRVLADRTWFTLVLDVEPYLLDGQLRVRVHSARWAFLPLPRIFWQGQADRINAQLERVFSRPPFNRVVIQDLNITDQSMTLTVALRHAGMP